MDRFLFGRRQIVTQDHTAQPRYEVIPLSADDALDPQPGDEFNVGPQHTADVAYISGCLQRHFRYHPSLAVVSQTKLVWPTALPGHPAPDIALLSNLHEPTRRRPIIDLTGEGCAVRVVIEVVAPLFAHQDQIERPRRYAAAGVPELWIVDSGERPEQPRSQYTIHGYRLEHGVYMPIQPDDDGRLVSPSHRFWFQVSDDWTSFQLGDLRTGMPLTPLAEDAQVPPAGEVEARLRAESIASKLNFLGE